MSNPPDIEQLLARIKELEEENERLKKWIEHRKTIERAKGILMVRHRWTEDTAFQHLQRYSMRSRVPMVELARRILNGEKIDLTLGIDPKKPRGPHQ